MAILVQLFLEHPVFRGYDEAVFVSVRISSRGIENYLRDTVAEGLM